MTRENIKISAISLNIINVSMCEIATYVIYIQLALNLFYFSST